jgi:ABC-type sulfate transport system permease component
MRHREGWTRAVGGSRFDRVFAALALALLLFVGVPILLLLPEVRWEALRLQFAERGLARAVGISVASATLATALAASLGVPAGRLLAGAPARIAWPARAVALLPTVLPPVAAGVLLLNVFGPAGPVGALLGKADAGFANAFAGIVLAQLFVAAPFVVLTAEAAFRSVDPRLVEAAGALGQGAGRTFRRVVLPLAAPGILAGLALGWMRAFGEFGATVVMAYHPRTLPVHLYVELTGRGLEAALPVALVALLVALTGLAAAARVQARRARRAPPPRLRGPARPAATPAPPPPSAGPASGPVLRADVVRELGDFRLDVAIEAGREIVSLFGPSGAGKTTLLRLIAGLDRPDGGSVRIAERHGPAASDGGRASGPRSVGLVFQEPALFPHMSVA